MHAQMHMFTYLIFQISPIPAP